MLDFMSIKEFYEGINYEFDIKRPNQRKGSLTWSALFYEDAWNYDLAVNTDYTFKNVFYVYLGHLICKHGKYILEHFANCITASIQEIEENYMNLDLTAEEQLEILEIARQVKDDLPKLKVFSDSVSLIEQEIKEYKNEKGLE